MAAPRYCDLLVTLFVAVVVTVTVVVLGGGAAAGGVGRDRVGERREGVV